MVVGDNLTLKSRLTVPFELFQPHTDAISCDNRIEKEGDINALVNFSKTNAMDLY